MTDSAPPDSRAAPVPLGRALLLAEIALVFGSFTLFAAWPVPDVNEAHYLAKARHFWDPTWITGDFFLETADAHAVFYRTIGWATLFLPLPVLAWLGRLLTWWLLAWSWRRLSWAIVPVAWMSVVSAALFVALLFHCEMAGEWIIGGVEAKGFAYVLVFLALEALVRDRWNRALLLLGGATAFHVLVGGWTTLFTGIAWWWLGRGQRPPLRSIWPGLAGGLALALPGLVPVLLLDWGAPADVAREASTIQVLHRLKHHLDPATFRPEAMLRHFWLVGAWVLLCRLTPYDLAQRRLRLVISISILTALTGICLAKLTRWDAGLTAAVLRYYWFRMGDALLPAGVSLVGLAFAHYLLRLNPLMGRFWLGFALAIGSLFMAGAGIERVFPQLPRGDRPGKVANYEDWRAACQWVAEHTPSDARFLTPRMAQTFRWYGQRAEVVSWKDMPQDAAGIVEWWQRVHDLHWEGDMPGDPAGRWRGSLNERTPADLRRLGEKYGANYLITEANPPLDLPLLYQNDTYAVYDLADRDGG
jgi:hypothetical protein